MLGEQRKLPSNTMWFAFWVAAPHAHEADVLNRDEEAVIFQTLPLPLTKNEKTTVDNFFNFCRSVACLLLHFIILIRQKPSFIAITLSTSLELIVPHYSVFLFFRY